MFNSIYVGNFKAFGQTQKVSLKPITLIFGPNSSGKSSIIHSLLLLNEINRQYLDSSISPDFDIHFTQKGGSSVDLGGFKQFIFKGDLRRKLNVAFEITEKQLERVYEIMNPHPQQSLFADSQHFFGPDTIVKIQINAAIQNLDDQDNLTEESYSKLESVEIQVSGEKLLKLSHKGSANYSIDWLNTKNPILKSIANRIFVNKIDIENNPQVFDKLNKLANYLNVGFESLLPSSLTVDYDKVRKSEFFNEIEIIEELSNLLNAFSKYFQEEIEKLEYLGPLRSYPPRSLDSSQDNDPNWISGGGFAWKVVRDNRVVRDKINNWLTKEDKIQVPYELAVQHLHTLDGIEKKYTEYVYEILGKYFNNYVSDLDEEEKSDLDAGDTYDLMENLMDQFREIEGNISLKKELVIKDIKTGTNVSHRDIGIGVSQVLPVLVSALGHTNKTIAIEQPEIHLHPAIQAELGDVFIEGALENNNNFILETHSEHLILRLLRRIRESNDIAETKSKKINPDDVAILYVEPDKKGSRVYEIPVDDEGEFTRPWPKGFFSERSKELF